MRFPEIKITCGYISKFCESEEHSANCLFEFNSVVCELEDCVYNVRGGEPHAPRFDDVG